MTYIVLAVLNIQPTFCRPIWKINGSILIEQQMNRTVRLTLWFNWALHSKFCDSKNCIIFSEIYEGIYVVKWISNRALSYSFVILNELWLNKWTLSLKIPLPGAKNTLVYDKLLSWVLSIVQLNNKLKCFHYLLSNCDFDFQNQFRSKVNK